MGFLEKIKNGLSRTKQNMAISMNNMFASFTGENEEFFDDLEETLILADAGVDTATDAVERLREVVKQRGLRGGEEVRAALSEILCEQLTAKDNGLTLTTKPSVILVVGVNGVGKTTTIGKLSARFAAEGKSVLLAAGDTFRAAAAEQLTIWAERSKADIVRHEEGSDPAAVVFDSIAAAKARGKDVIIIDIECNALVTNGQLHAVCGGHGLDWNMINRRDLNGLSLYIRSSAYGPNKVIADLITVKGAEIGHQLQPGSTFVCTNQCCECTNHVLLPTVGAVVVDRGMRKGVLTPVKGDETVTTVQVADTVGVFNCPCEHTGTGLIDQEVL